MMRAGGCTPSWQIFSRNDGEAHAHPDEVIQQSRDLLRCTSALAFNSQWLRTDFPLVQLPRDQAAGTPAADPRKPGSLSIALHRGYTSFSLLSAFSARRI